MKLLYTILIITSLFSACSPKDQLHLELDFPDCSNCFVEVSTINPFDFHKSVIDTFYLNDDGYNNRQILIPEMKFGNVSIDTLSFPIPLQGGESLKLKQNIAEIEASGSLGSAANTLVQTNHFVNQFSSDNIGLDQFLIKVDSFKLELNRLVKQEDLSKNHQELLSKSVEIHHRKYLLEYALMNYNLYKRDTQLSFLNEDDRFPDYPELLHADLWQLGALARMYFVASVYPQLWPKTDHADSTEQFGFRADSLIKSINYSSETEEYLRAINIKNLLDGAQNIDVLRRLTISYQKAFPSSEFLSSLNVSLNGYASLEEGTKAPNIIGEDALGNRVELSKFNGKIVFVDMWATWCKPCIESIPKILSIKDQLDESKVEFLFVSIDENKEKWREFNEKLLTGNTSLIIERESSVHKDYMVGGIPRYIIISKEGTIINAFASIDDLENLL